MKKLLTSLLTLGLVGAVAWGATQAFFSDTEVSQGNEFVAGSLDLKIDSTQHYDGLICLLDGDDTYRWADEETSSFETTTSPRPELLGEPCFGSWELTDLDETKQFFNLTDIKPGDWGENTISWHVFDNDAWGRIRVANVLDQDNSCNEPEEEAEPDCNLDEDGELDNNMVYSIWLDEGLTPGFQCYRPEGRLVDCDPTEGDNVHQDYEVIDTEEQTATVGQTDFFLDMGPALQQAYIAHSCSVETGHTNYTECHGLAADGRLVGSATYYMGLAWRLPGDTGNEVQTDSLGMDIGFEIEQHRNNPTPFNPGP